MRFKQHWLIAKDIAGDKANLAYQLGSIFPDYFERLHRHTMSCMLESIHKRIDKIQRMPDGLRKQYLMGTVMHYMCDFCSYAHNDDVYNKWIRHRLYELNEQRFFLKHRKIQQSDKWWFDQSNLYINNVDANLEHNRFVCEWLVVGFDDWWKDQVVFTWVLYAAYQTCDKAYELMTKKG